MLLMPEWCVMGFSENYPVAAMHVDLPSVGVLRGSLARQRQEFTGN